MKKIQIVIIKVFCIVARNSIYIRFTAITIACITLICVYYSGFSKSKIDLLGISALSFGASYLSKRISGTPVILTTWFGRNVVSLCFLTKKEYTNGVAQFQNYLEICYNYLITKKGTYSIGTHKDFCSQILKYVNRKQNNCIQGNINKFLANMQIKQKHTLINNDNMHVEIWKKEENKEILETVSFLSFKEIWTCDKIKKKDMYKIRIKIR